MKNLFYFAKQLLCGDCVDLSQQLSKENENLRAELSKQREARKYYAVSAVVFGLVLALIIVGVLNHG